MAISAGCLPYIGFVGRLHPEDIRRKSLGGHPEDIIRRTSGRPPEITGEGENSSARLIWGIYA